MKKFLKPGVALGLAGILSPYFFSDSPDFSVPRYTLQGARKTESYHVILNEGLQVLQKKKDLKLFEGFPYRKVVNYFVDSNRDGKTDIIHEEVSIPKQIIKGSKGAIEIEKEITLIFLFVDDPDNGKYGGTLDRVLYDTLDEKGNLGSDGKFDGQRIIKK